MANIPTIIYAGTSISWQDSYQQYPATEFTLKYTLRGPTALDITASAYGNDYKVELTPTDTENWIPGHYWWYAIIEKQNFSIVIASGETEILPNPQTISSPFDGRSQIKRILDTLQAVMEGRASEKDLELEINGRRIKKMSHQELIEAYKLYKELYKQELFSQGKLKNNVFYLFRSVK